MQSAFGGYTLDSRHGVLQGFLGFVKLILSHSDTDGFNSVFYSSFTAHIPNPADFTLPVPFHYRFMFSQLPFLR
jgi:hypothetical protein